MDAGRRQKGNIKISLDELKNRIIGVGVKKDDPNVPIDKVRKVTKSDSNKTVQVKKVTARVSARRNPARIENVGYEGDGASIPEDGTDIFNFRTGRFKLKAGNADILKGDGTHVVKFLKKKIRK